MSVPGRDSQAPLGDRYGTRPGNGVPRSVFEPAAGLDAGALGPNGIGPGGGPGADGTGRDPRLGRAGVGSSLVRPYAVTGGRTKPRTQLEIEAMVAAAHYEARDLSVLSHLGGGRMADCDRRCWCRPRARITRRPSPAGMARGRAMAYPGRCLSLRLALMPVALMPAAWVPAPASVPAVLGAIHAWGERARGVLWFGRMR